MRSKFTPESWARLQNHLYRSPLATPSPSCSNTPAHMETSKLQPLGPILCLPTPPPPLKENKSWSPAPSLQNSGSHVGWVCSCYRFLHIKKKKKSHVQGQNDKGCFPTPAPESPRVQLTALALASKGSAHLFNHLGQQLPAPSPPPPSHGLAKGLAGPEERELDVSSNTKTWVLFSEKEAKQGCIPGKRKDTLLSTKSHLLAKGNINSSVPKLALLFLKKRKKEKKKKPQPYPKAALSGAILTVGMWFRAKTLQGGFKFGKNQSWTEGTPESLHQGLRKAGEQVAPAEGSRAKTHLTGIPCRDQKPPASQPLGLCPQMQREIEKKIFSHLLPGDQPFRGE